MSARIHRLMQEHGLESSPATLEQKVMERYSRFDDLPPAMMRHVLEAYVRSDKFFDGLRIPFECLVTVSPAKRSVQDALCILIAACPDSDLLSMPLMQYVYRGKADPRTGLAQESFGTEVRSWYDGCIKGTAGETVLEAVADYVERLVRDLPCASVRQILAMVFCRPHIRLD